MDALIFPGKGKPWIDGIGEKVLEAGYSASGIDIDEIFLDLTFSEQVTRSKLFIEKEWDRCPLLIGKSYGGYLLLHALADLPPYPWAEDPIYDPELAVRFDGLVEGYKVVRGQTTNLKFDFLRCT